MSHHGLTRPRRWLARATRAPSSLALGLSLLVGYWSGLDLLVNPYETTAYQKGRVLVRVMRDVDVAVRHPESLSTQTISWPKSVHRLNRRRVK